MGQFVAGEVVVLPFPQTNLQPGKRRPALVVATPLSPDVILCQITSQSRGDAWSVALTRGDFDLGALAVDSFVRINRLFTVEGSVISYTVGKVKEAKLREIRTKLRQLFPV